MSAAGGIGCREAIPGKVLDKRNSYVEETLWPHLRSAYNLARWMVRNDHDAEDIVQESFAKAFQAIDAFRGGDARVWILTIVRNTTLNFLRRRHGSDRPPLQELKTEPVDHAPDAERELIDRSRREKVRQAIEQLPPEYRDALILREMEGLAYKEIAAVLKMPIGTVMSRLSRARNLLIQELLPEKEGQP